MRKDRKEGSVASKEGAHALLSLSLLTSASALASPQYTILLMQISARSIPLTTVANMDKTLKQNCNNTKTKLTKTKPTTQNKSHNTKTKLTTQKQNSQHHNKSHNTKPNLTTQKQIMQHKIKSHNTEKNHRDLFLCCRFGFRVLSISATILVGL